MNSDTQNDTSELRELFRAFMQPSPDNDGSLLDTFTVTTVGLRHICEVFAQREQAAELRGRINEHHVISGLLTNTELAALPTPRLKQRLATLQATKPEKGGLER